MRRTALAFSVASVTALALVGCATSGSDSDPGLSVVASTDVYGSITQSIAGDLAVVESIIDNPQLDPHSYEATARDRLAVSRADIVVRNGGGYDPFMDPLIADGQTVITAVEASPSYPGDAHHDAGEDAGHGDHSHGDDGDHGHLEGFNEHVWYDVHAMMTLVISLSDALAAVDPDNAATYETNAQALFTELDALHEELHALEHEFEGRSAAVTEPAPGYLLSALGLTNETPDAFARAVEAGIEVPPAALMHMLKTIESGGVELLVWNPQTTGPEIERAVAAAREAGIPVVEASETLPAGVGYREWLAGVVDAMAKALRG